LSGVKLPRGARLCKLATAPLNEAVAPAIGFDLAGTAAIFLRRLVGVARGWSAPGG
jgi:hypothetical protein